MDDRSVRLHGRERIQDGGNLLVLDLDRESRLLGSLHRVGSYHGYLVADEANAVAAEERDVAQHTTVKPTWKISSGQDSPHDWNGLRPRDVDRNDASMRKWAVQAGRPESPG